MNRLLKKLIPLTTVAFLSGLSGAIATPAAKAFTIDTFDDGNAALQTTTTASDLDTGLSGPIGGVRDSSLTSNNFVFTQAFVNNDPPGPADFTGQLGFEALTGGDATVDILYDANGTGLGGVDITEAGDNDRFRLAVITGNNLRTNNGGGVSLTTILLTVIDDQLTPETATANVNFPTDSFTGAFDIDFGLFTANNANIDLTSIDSIEISINIPDSAPSQIALDSFIATVPFNFQSSAGLALAGGALAGSYYFKKKKKAGNKKIKK
ncbi:hypothetical protein Pse7367_1135 [Thalassoporum mexicanum PCC 7367]|uniref:PFE-CTERM domain-containing protein n=1 Tax=Thalassoporum mexicanum TaxID=3457544 RepID=UPI00029FE08D|nr:hypothetical protein [Pseudanabaena sp. PCC 7367]AFY69432.1 hypothetical protein Pse7367_1135 [Pseudanabaena sp. PCC 7367]